MMTDELKALVSVHLGHDLKKECENVIGVALLLRDQSVFFSSGTLEKEQSVCISFLLWIMQSTNIVFGCRK